MRARALGLALLLTATLLLAAPPQPATAQAGPVLGGQLYSSGGPVEVEVRPAGAALTSELWLLEPGPETFIATNREVGKIVAIGPFMAGVELIFGIRVRGNEYRMGPGERNPDGLIHAQVEFLEEGRAIVGFEDLFGGGDRDYDDNVFEFRGGIAPEPPDPDPDPDPTPGALGPVADAGPDQTVTEGSTVALDGSASFDRGSLNLVASTADGNLPGGTSVSASLTELGGIADGTQPLSGSVAIGEGAAVPDTAIAYIIDLSGSANFGGGCAGDQNGDGAADRIIDCEIAAILELHDEVLAADTVKDVALVTFSSSARAEDLDPTAAVAQLIGPADDRDANGVLDLEQRLRALRAGGATNIPAAANAACNVLAGSTASTRIAVFMSDGASNRGGAVANVLPCANPTVFEAFAIGANNSCTSGRVGAKLQDVADLTGGTCTNVPDTGNLPDILPGVVGARLVSAFLSIDGAEPQDISADVGLPTDAPADVSFTLEIAALGTGLHEICLTVVGTDAGGESSITTCSEASTVEGPLSYEWRALSAIGPPVVLSSSTAEQPAFLAIDDGTYTFELTVISPTGLTDTDEVTVTVTNLDPVATIESREAFAGGVTLLTGSVTDPGWLDGHEGTIDWGDGTVAPVVVSAQGAGWASMFGSHIYADPGTYTVLLTVADDDGGTATATIAALEVSEPAALWANSTTTKKTLDWTGGSGSVTGTVHSNNEVRIAGDPKTIDGNLEYVSKLTLDGEHVFTPDPTVVSPEGFPISYDIADFSPGGTVQQQVGDRYFDRSSDCSSSEGWHLNQEVLDDGVYFAACDLKLNGSNIGGRVTLVATGTIEVSGSRPAFEPYYDGVLFISGATGDNGVKISASNSKFLGVVFAGSGEIEISGAGNRFFCGIYGDTIDISGSSLDVRGASCGRPSSTVADPLVVPELNLELSADAATVAPGGAIGYELLLTNAGSLLVVPGVVGLENVDESPTTVQSYSYVLEYLDLATSQWLPFASVAAAADGSIPIDPLPTLGGVDVVWQPNQASGVTYPAEPEVILGTVLAPGGFATWGYQALVDLSPQLVATLLDPAQVGGIRNRVEFELAPSSVQTRRLFRYGTDFIDRLRTLSGDISDIRITQTFPSGDPQFIAAADDSRLATLLPGESITLADSRTVATLAPAADGESPSGYLSRLLAADGALFAGTAYARGSGGVGLIVAPQDVALTSQQLPVVAIAKTGPASASAGSIVDWDIALNNLGSAAAVDIMVSDELDGEPLVVAGAPAALDPAAIATAGASHGIPIDSDGTPIENVAAVTWQDSTGNAYGPLTSRVTTEVATAPLLAASLTDTLAADNDGNGLVSPGDTIGYEAILTNLGDQPLTGVGFAAAVDANTSVVTGSLFAGTGTIVSGNDAGDTTVAVVGGTINGNSTATITWQVTIADPLPEGVFSVVTFGIVTSNELVDVQTDDPAVPGTGNPTTTAVALRIPALEVSLAAALVVDPDGNSVPSPGDTLRFTSVIANAGGDAATSLVAAYPLDPNTTIVAGTAATTAGSVTRGSVAGDRSVEVGIATLAAGADATVTFDVLIDSPFPLGVENIAIQGIVSSAELQPVLSDDATSAAEADPTVVPVFGADGTPGGGGGAPPGAAITDITPPEGSIVTAPISVSVGAVTPPDTTTVTGWRLIAYPEGGDPAAGRELAAGIGDPPPTLGSFDPTVVSNGIWILRVEVTDSAGGIGLAESRLIVDGQLKPGRFLTTFQDLSVGVAGVPLQVLRTYDSFDKTPGDFGVGWTLDVADFRVASNGPLGDGGWLMEQCGGGLIFVPLCFRSERPHFVTVTWPNGLTEIFDLTPTQGSTFFPGLTSAQFTGRPNTTSKLAAVDTSLFWSNGDLLGGGFGSGGIYDPDTFVLTDRLGTKYRLGVGVGLLAIEDRNGNTLTFTDDGIVSSRGPGIDFIRDGLGRITSVVGPDGETLTYTYDAAGDLVAVTDPNGNATTYTYLPGHYLDDITDPLGRLFRTLEYDAAGRLSAVIDAEGNRTEIASDVGARQEVVTDAAGRLTTISTYDDRGNVIQVDEIFDGHTQTSTFTYDGFDNRVSRTDPAGNTWTAVYDGQDLVSMRYPTGAEINLVYDAFGFPTSWTDPLGESTAYTYDIRGNLTSVVDALGNAETYTYDGLGNRLTRTDREGNTWIFAYDGAGRLTSQTDPLGAVSTLFYDGSGRVTSVTDALGNTTSLTYNAVGQLTGRTDPLGFTTVWTYDAADQLVSRTDAEGFTTSWLYDGAGRALAETDPLGNVTSFAYDQNGRLTARTAADGGIAGFAYDGLGRLASETDPVGRVTSYTYDAAGRLATATNPAGGVTSRGYDAAGNLISETDPLGNVSTWTYDGQGRVTSMTDPLGRTTTFEYDAAGRRTKVIDAAGGESTTGYDAAGRVVATTNPAGETSVLGYDAVGSRVSATDPLGNTTTFGYDPLRRLTSVTDALGNTSANAYDAAGRLTQSTSAAGIVTTFGYDGRGLQTSVTDGLGNSRQTAYDGAGQAVAETDARGNVTILGYDSVGRMTSMTDALGNVVGFGYDLAGQQTSRTDANGATWTTAYDLLGGVASETDPLGRVSSMTYDLLGRLSSETDGRGVTVTYGYDAAAQLTTVTAPGETVAHGYDALGRRVSMTDNTGSTSWSYDPVGRPLQVTAPGGVVSYGYDPAGRRTSLTQPEGTVGYGYDAAGRLTSLTDLGGGTSTYGYDADGRLTTITRPNGVATSRTYDAAGRLDRIDHTAAGLSVFFDYTLDADGNRVGLASSAGSESYSINAINQLALVSYANGDVEAFTYDAAGNRLTRTLNGVAETYVYDAAGQLTSLDGVAYTYDGAGNRLTAGADSYTWDWAGRLAAAMVGGVGSTYTYDGDGVRVSATEGGVTTDFLWDRASGLELLISDGTTGYTYGNGELLAQTTATTEYLLDDALGSVREVTDSAGVSVGSADYAVFGDTRSATGSGSVFGFTGEQSDPTGLQYLRARYLDPSSGTFLSVDPVAPGAGGVVGYNPYTYVGNNPTTWTDPSGEVAITAQAGLTAAQRRLLAALIATGLAAFIILAFQQLVDVLDRPNTNTKDDTGDEPGDQPGDEPGPGDRPGPTVPPPPVCVNSLPGGPDIIPGVDIPIIEDCDPRDDNRDRPVLFGQARISPTFSDGNTLEETAEDLASGLSLEVSVWDNDGTLIALSNRTLAAYSLAGIVYPPIVISAPTRPQRNRLAETPSCLGGGLPSSEIAVTTLPWNRGCGETLQTVTSIVRYRE